MPTASSCIVLAFSLVLAAPAAVASHAAQDAKPAAPALPDRVAPARWLVLSAVDAGGRRPFNASAPFARYLLALDAPAPAAGEEVTGDLGEKRAWTVVEPGADGRVGGDAAWAFTTIESPTERVMLANLQGAGRLYVNGAGFAGDLYGYGFGGVPIALKAGSNRVFVSGIRGGFRLELSAVADAIVVGDWDVTRPMLRRGEAPGFQFAAVPVMNATNAPVTVALASSASKTFQSGTCGTTSLPPLGIDKPMIEMQLLAAAPKDGDKLAFPLTVNGKEHPLELALVDPAAVRRLTFPSRVDGSVQECSVRPALEATKNVVLTLHGASVDAFNQAASYSAKKDFLFVAPTNRRPFGFDWQDWGRANAYEALAAGIRPTKSEDVSVFLTGHSMGGHGTWHLAVNDQFRFVAIAPSAGWSGFDSYGGGKRDGELAATWRGADGASDTLALLPNIVKTPVYVLHGSADDNVPVSEAERMAVALRELGAPPAMHVQDGAGHWWDGDAAPGADCVDWPGIFETFRAAKPRAVNTELDAWSADPSVQSVLGWCELLQPVRYGERLHVRSRFDREKQELVVETENVRAFRIRTAPDGWRGGVITIDGTRMELKAWDYSAPFLRTADGWKASAKEVDLARQKTPEFSGPFKRAFDRGFVLVYGTAGDEREDAELLARARCDAESWWYRANGSVRVVRDDDFVTHGLGTWVFGVELEDFVPNVVLYGNADTNSAWTKVLGADTTIEARRGTLRVGERTWKGDDLAAVFVRPRVDKEGRTIALVGAFADTGVRGARLSYVLAPFASGVGYPDYAVFDANVLAKGDGGVLAAGFFDADWKLDPRAFVRAAPDAKAGR
ncbi:MAG: prolyl oligopeptidase family serine peptidase [Planctomycetes bacterium]|nr:prolyl oligopeptidase family serine peptidase [Planctomycetota bacterium]